MKFKNFLLVLSISLCTFFFSSNYFANNESLTKYPHTAHVSSEILYAGASYERVYIDGVWWIIVYEDGVKTQQYIDPDQS